MNTQKVKVICLPVDIDTIAPKDALNTLFKTKDEVFNIPTSLEDVLKSQQWFGNTPQHLYFLDTNPNTKIKEGDWFRLTINNGSVGSPHYHIGKMLNTLYNKEKNTFLFEDVRGGEATAGIGWPCHKIVAASNSFIGLPGIEESFIKLYAEKQGKIDEVNVELYEILHQQKPQSVQDFPKLINGGWKYKLNPQNQVIVVNTDKIEAQEEIHSTRQVAKEEFDKLSKHSSLLDWHTWKRAFDCAVEWQKQQTPFSREDMKKSFEHCGDKLNVAFDNPNFEEWFEKTYPEHSKNK